MTEIDPNGMTFMVGYGLSIVCLVLFLIADERNPK